MGCYDEYGTDKLNQDAICECGALALDGPVAAQIDEIAPAEAVHQQAYAKQRMGISSQRLLDRSRGVCRSRYWAADLWSLSLASNTDTDTVTSTTSNIGKDLAGNLKAAPYAAPAGFHPYDPVSNTGGYGTFRPAPVKLQ